MLPILLAAAQLPKISQYKLYYFVYLAVEVGEMYELSFINILKKKKNMMII